MKSLKDYIVETETKQVTEGILDWAKKIFTPKDPTPQTPITAADIDAGMKDPAFVAQVQSAAAALNISPEQLVTQLKQQVGPAAPAAPPPAAPPAPPAAPAAPAAAPAAVPVGEGFMDTVKKGYNKAVNTLGNIGIMPPELLSPRRDANGNWNKRTNEPRNNFIYWLQGNPALEPHADELLASFDKWVDDGNSDRDAGKHAKDEWQKRMKTTTGAVSESAEHDSGSTFEHICRTFKRDVKDFQTTGELSEHLYDALYDYYVDDMPYGTKKARDGDPYEWIGNRFYNDLNDQSDTGIAEMVRLAGLPTVQDEGIEDIPAFMRKGKPGEFPAPIMPRPDTKIKHSPVRPENIPAVHRSGPVSLDQIRDNSDKMSDLQTLRRMAGLPDRPEHGSPL